jgi:hypothetical protein
MTFTTRFGYSFGYRSGRPSTRSWLHMNLAYPGEYPDQILGYSPDGKAFLQRLAYRRGLSTRFQAIRLRTELRKLRR